MCSPCGCHSRPHWQLCACVAVERFLHAEPVSLAVVRNSYGLGGVEFFRG
jgi:hypothetical protein